MNTLKRALKRALSVTNINGSTTDIGAGSTAGKKRSKTIPEAMEEPNIMEEVFSSVLSQSGSQPAAPVSAKSRKVNGTPANVEQWDMEESDVDDACSAANDQLSLHADISKLLQIVEQQHRVIKTLDAKMNKLLAHCGLQGKHAVPKPGNVPVSSLPTDVTASSKPQAMAQMSAVERRPQKPRHRQNEWARRSSGNRWRQTAVVSDGIEASLNGGGAGGDTVNYSSAHHKGRFPVRQQNVVVQGLPESDSMSDAAAFTELCEYNLPIKPVVDDNNCVRIGRAQSGEPRRLLVQLESEEIATSLLQVARYLRQSEDDYTAYNVYVNPDLSPSSAKRAYEQRQQRRLQHQWHGTQDVYHEEITEHQHRMHLDAPGHESLQPAVSTGVCSSAVEGNLVAPSTAVRDLVIGPAATSVLPSLPASLSSSSSSSTVATGMDSSSIQTAGQLSKLSSGASTDSVAQSAVVADGIQSSIAAVAAVTDVPLPNSTGFTLNPRTAPWSGATATSTLMAGGPTVMTGGDLPFLGV